MILRVCYDHIPGVCRGLMATPPMQTFCTAGKSASHLVQPIDAFLQTVKAKQPDVLMIQQVRGMLRPNRRAQFTAAVAALSSLGYTCSQSEEDSLVVAFRQ